MRLRKLNGLMMVAVSSALAGMTASISGCKHHAPPKATHPTPLQPIPPAPTVPATEATTGPATEATTAPTAGATTGPTTEATTAPTAGATTGPAVGAIIAPAAGATPGPTTEATTAPTTSPVSEPAAGPTTAAVTPPTIVPPTVPVVPAPTTAPATLPVAILPATVPAVAPVPVPTPETAPVPATAPVVTPTTVPVPAVLPAAVLPATNPVLPTAPTTAPATMPAPIPVPPVAVVPPTKDAAPPTDPDEIEGDAALAEQIASIAELSFPPKVDKNEAWPLLWNQQAALYSAASTLNPAESRYCRLTADADAQAKDIDGEIKALYLATLAKPDDEFSWNKRLDLLLSRVQIAGAQIKYLRGVMDSKKVPPDVRAHAGFRSAEIMLARGQDAAASTVLEEALRYNPSSVECLTLRYSMLPASAPRFERVSKLLDLLRANPLQWQYSAQVAELTAASGLLKQSIPWYNLAVSCAHQQHVAASDTVLDMAAALYISDRRFDAANLVSSLLEFDPKYYPGWFMQVVLTQAGGDKDAAAKAVQFAGNVMSNRVIEVVNQVAKSETNQPTTRPVTADGAYTLPDLQPVVAKLNADNVPQSKRLFIEAVADLARLDIQFAGKPEAAAPLIEALHGLLPANDPLLAQLQGWSALVSSKPDEARAKLSTIAAQDPLGQLGLIKLLIADPDGREQAESMARKLVQDNPSGLVGAMIWQSLRSERVKLILSSQSVALQQELAQFPPAILATADKPQNTYSIHAVPTPAGRRFGDPLLARVTIVNSTDNDLTIGDDGVVKPQLFFRVTAEVGPKPITFQAVDNLACPTVLKAHSYVDQTIRVDQSQMLAFLSNPDTTATAFEISSVLSTNETANRLGGYLSQFTKSFFRLPTPAAPDQMQIILANLASGPPTQRISALTQLELLVKKLQKVNGPDGNVNKAIPPLIDQLHNARGDSIAAVAAWATKCEFELSEGDDRINILHDMVEDSDWRHRQLALALLPTLDEPMQKQVLAKLVTDPQTSVRATAIAIQGLKKISDASPTSEPTTMP